MEIRKAGAASRRRLSSVVSLKDLGLAKQKKAKNMDVKRMFQFIRFTQFACVVWIVITSFAREPIGLLRDDNTIQPRDTVMATTPLHLVCLAISRISAYSMYPAMVLVFLSKAKALQTWLESTCLSIFIPFYDLHSVHEAMGHWIAVDVWIHGLFHTIRWADQGKLHYYWSTPTGLSGLIVIALTPLIAFPMMFEFIKKRLSYEVRKGLHYLCIPFGIGIAFHAPAMHIGYVMGVVTSIYLADYCVRWLCMTHKITSSEFFRLDNGIQLSFENPHKNFASTGGYILLNVPFVSRSEWHAFSVFSHPVLPNHSCVCVSKSGDWTAALHQAVQRPTVRPTWIQGPFPSPFKTTEDFDNLVLVASGVGITPALSAINRFKDDGRKYNLVWACRDASLIEFYAHSISHEATGWVLIYYTGSRPLRFSDTARRLPPTVRIFKNRPNLCSVITRLIEGVESRSWLPEEMLVWSETFFGKLAVLSDHVNYEHEGESAITKIRAILVGLLDEYSAKDMFDVLLHTFCNLESDRDTLDHPALVDFFRAMVNTGQHPRSEERAFVSIFDPSGSGFASEQAFGAAIERIMHSQEEEHMGIPRELTGLSHVSAAPVATPSSRISGLGDRRISGLLCSSLRERAVAPTVPESQPLTRVPTVDHEYQHNSGPLCTAHLLPGAVLDAGSDSESGGGEASSGGSEDRAPSAGMEEAVLDPAPDSDSESCRLPPKLSVCSVHTACSAQVVFAGAAPAPHDTAPSAPEHPSSPAAGARGRVQGPRAAMPRALRAEATRRESQEAAFDLRARHRVRRCSSNMDGFAPHALSIALDDFGDAAGHLHPCQQALRKQSTFGLRTDSSGREVTADILSMRPDFLTHLRACRATASEDALASFCERNDPQQALRSKESRESWQILFCGGPASSALRDAMNEVALNLRVSLRTETFNW